MRFFRLPKFILFVASVFFCAKLPKIMDFGLPKPSQNAFKVDVPKNMRFFMDFCCFFVACCKSRTSNFMRPRNVLLAFHNNRVFAFGLRFWSKKPTKNLPKTRPEPFKNRCRNRVVFQHRFFHVLVSILGPLGPPRWSQVG